MPTYKSNTVKAPVAEKVEIELNAAEVKDGYEIKRAGRHPRDMVCVKPGSQAMATALAAAYGMSLEDAAVIIKERKENPLSWPYEEFLKARAMLAAFKATPIAISTTPHYQRSRGLE